MQMPHTTTSGATLVKEFGLYHLTRLRADKGLKEMADGWEKSQARLRDRVAAHEAAQASTLQAMAIRDGEDAALDDAVRRFYGALLQASGNNRKAPSFGIYFPEGVTAMVNAPMEAEIQKVAVLISKLAEEEDESLKSHAGILTESMNNLSAAVDAHKAALASELQAYGLVEQEKVNWMDSYKFDHRTLAQKFFKEAKKADTFFKPAPKAKKATVPPAPAAN
jgi:hypothetical protein